jgi:hypothetical protein
MYRPLVPGTIILYGVCGSIQGTTHLSRLRSAQHQDRRSCCLENKGPPKAVLVVSPPEQHGHMVRPGCSHA